MTKEQLSQLVQDVIDGNESAVKAWKIMSRLGRHVSWCIKEIAPYVIEEKRTERNGNSKDNDKPGTF